MNMSELNKINKQLNTLNDYKRIKKELDAKYPRPAPLKDRTLSRSIKALGKKGSHNKIANKRNTSNKGNNSKAKNTNNSVVQPEISKQNNKKKRKNWIKLMIARRHGLYR